MSQLPGSEESTLETVVVLAFTDHLLPGLANDHSSRGDDDEDKEEGGGGEGDGKKSNTHICQVATLIVFFFNTDV